MGITAKNGALSRDYNFAIVKLMARGGAYSDRMVEQCKKVGMKPVCDHRNYCWTFSSCSSSSTPPPTRASRAASAEERISPERRPAGRERAFISLRESSAL